VSIIIHKISLRSIDAKRFVNDNLGVRNIRITNSSSITSLQMEDTRLVVGFLYAVEYYPAYASIKFEGQVVYSSESLSTPPNEVNQLPQEVTKEIQGAIFRYCLPELVLVAKQLDLAPPIPMPSMDQRRDSVPPAPQVKDNAYDYR